MKTVTECPACGSSLAQTVAVLNDESRQRFLLFSDLKYGGLLDDWLPTVPPVVMQCDGCGHCWYRHQPEPQQLDRMYAAGRPLGGGMPASREPTPHMISEMQRLLRLVDSSNTQPGFFDFGSGRGRWARAAARVGFTVTAFEPSTDRGAEPGAPFELVHSLDEVNSRRFDVIQLEQVLEHVPDPLATLTQLRQHCHPRTIVRITVPNTLRDADAAVLWQSWPFNGSAPHVLAPFEHLHGFTPRSLCTLAQRAGFESIALARLLRHCPALPVRRWLSALRPALGATALLLQPRAAQQ